ncbi:hypothetical protein [Flagellimonas onchidii]|uniref:hypothetical protein n=1 Tax=Flagellimonas onchidii TaxID=2562684 RepID=UPI0010A66353|nr:hypothetical protein [Allomuricauda onchidii]
MAKHPTNNEKNIKAILETFEYEEGTEVQVIGDGLYQIGDQQFTTQGNLNNNYKPKKISKGLGDDIEKITEATGIKKVVEFFTDGRDCGCTKRKEVLNKLFPRMKPNCFTEEQYRLWGETSEAIKETRKVTPDQQKTIVKLLRDILNMAVAPCSRCNSGVWTKYISMLDNAYNTYQN